MTTRRAISGVLLGFVLFTAGFAVGKEVGTRKALEGPRLRAASRPSPCVATPKRQLIAYYFHGTKRCKKCNAIEAYSREALDQEFADYLESGDIVWQTANMDDVWNQELVSTYGLTTSSLVLVDVQDGRELGHTVCHRTWDLVADKETFLAYIQSEVEMYLAEWASDEKVED